MKITIILALLFSGSLLADDKSICGIDDRVPSSEPQIARALGKITDSGGCTITMISSRCAISAGHCKKVLNIAEFNTPPSRGGRIQHPAKEDIYEIDNTGKTVVYEGLGNDWAVMRLKANKTTGLFAGDAQGFYEVTFDKVKIDDEIRITGFGVDKKDPTRNLAQQTHNGRVVAFGTYEKSVMYHNADTMGGNSGSSIINLNNGKIVAIHTNGGCRRNSGKNASTMISETPALISAIKSCLNTEN